DSDVVPWLHEKLQFQQEPDISNDSQTYAANTKKRQIGPLRVRGLRDNFCLAYTSSLHDDGDYDASRQKRDPNPDLWAISTGKLGAAPQSHRVIQSVPNAGSLKEWRTPERQVFRNPVEDWQVNEQGDAGRHPYTCHCPNSYPLLPS